MDAITSTHDNITDHREGIIAKSAGSGSSRLGGCVRFAVHYLLSVSCDDLLNTGPDLLELGELAAQLIGYPL